MTLNNLGFNALPSPAEFGNAAERLSRLQSDFISETLRRAVNDVGAAMAHQLGEPVSALLLYLHEMKQAGEPSDGAEAAPASMREIVDMAIRETERVRKIIERVGHAAETPIGAETAVIRGCEAIDSWTRYRQGSAGRLPSPAMPHNGQRSLTPRELEVLALITEGTSNKEGGYRLGISTRTFEAHRAHLMAKCGAKNAADLVRLALSNDH